MINKKILIIGALLLVIILFILLARCSERVETDATDSSGLFDDEIAVQPESAITKIEKASEDLTLDSYLTLLTIATFDYENVPPAYAGAPEKDFGTQLLHLIAEKYDDLLPETQEALAPFILFPEDPGSFWYEERKPSILERLLLLPSVSAMEHPREDGSKVYIRNENFAYKEKTAMVKEAFDKAYASYTRMGMKEPTNWVYISLNEGLGQNDGLEYMTRYEGQDICVLLLDVTLEKKKLQSSTAHELFHCFQDHIPLKPYSEDAWLYESTATWAEEHVYPTMNTEHEYDSSIFTTFSSYFFDRSDLREYGSYLWWFYLDQQDGKTGTSVKAFLDSAATLGKKGAMQKMPLLTEEMKEYALWNINMPPFKFYADTGGQPTRHPIGHSVSVAKLTKREKLQEDVILMEGATKYYGYPIMTDAIKRVRIDISGINAKRKATNGVQLIYKLGSQLYYEDVSDRDEIEFCRTRPSEHVSMVILIATNADLNDLEAAEMEIDTRGECAPAWSGFTEVRWDSSETKDLSDEVISGDGASGTVSKRGYLLSREKLVYDKEYDEFFVTEQHMTYKFDAVQLIRYDRECSFLWEKDAEKTFGAVSSSWKFTDGYSTEAPVKFSREESDDAYTAQLVINPDADFLQGTSESGYAKVDCGYDGYLADMTPIFETQYFDTPSSLPSLDEAIIELSDDQKRLEGKGTVPFYSGGGTAEYTMKYAYG